MDCPELEKIKAHQPETLILGQFLEWLQDVKKIVLAEFGTDKYRNEHDILRPVNVPFEKLFAEYFEIDLNKAEQERQKLLDSIRKG